MRHAVNAAIAFSLSLLPLGASQATVLQGCFDSPQEYAITYEHELSSSENTVSKSFDAGGYLVGSGGEMTANCACPNNLFSSTKVFEATYSGSPLTAGVSGYAYLTDNVDIALSGYSDAINNPSGSGLTEMKITAYPTNRSSMPSVQETYSYTEKTADICSDSTRPSGGASVKRTFKWNVIRANLYIKKPILGEEIIQPALVLQYFTCLFFGSDTCSSAEAEQVSNIWFSGRLTAPLSCTINAGSTIEVDFGAIVNSQFVSPGQPPQSFTLKNVDIAYHCDGPAVGNDDKIKITFSADQGVVDGSQSYIAKLVGRSDLGIRMYDDASQNVVLDGTATFPVTLDEQGNGSIKMKAAPVSTTSSRPEPGSFEGNITVQMDLR